MDPDQLAFTEANWTGSSLLSKQDVIRYIWIQYGRDYELGVILRVYFLHIPFCEAIWIQSNLLLWPHLLLCDSPVSVHFSVPQMLSNANAPLLSVYLSNAASGWWNSPPNTEIESLNGHFLWFDAASLIGFHPFTFLHWLYAWCNWTPQQRCLLE